MTDVVQEMVSRFLSWKLPTSVCADPCVSDASYQHDRLGTNLLTADEARQMVEHLLGKETAAERPAEPTHDKDAWYRGWEIGWNDMSAKWAGAGWDAYKGGCDLGAPRITTAGFSDCLDEIDDYEDGSPPSPA